MLSLIEAIKFNKPIKRKIWSSFYYNTNFYNLKKEDILAKDWEIVTRSRNSKHAYEIGLNKPRVGEKSNLSKLTEKQIIQIKRLLDENKLSQKEIGKLFNTEQSNISKIKHKITWSHL